MIFKSKQVNLDPHPWLSENGPRYKRPPYPHTTWSLRPRPEFEPTRDPEPWLHTHVSENCHDTGGRMSFNNGIGYEWSPRREQFDTPVNPILVEFRNTLPNTNGGSAPWLAAHWTCSDEMWRQMCLSDHHDEAVPIGTPEHEAHARKVLTRLARLSESSNS